MRASGLALVACLGLIGSGCGAKSTDAAAGDGSLARGSTRDGTKWTVRVTGRSPRWCLRFDERQGTSSGSQTQCAQGTDPRTGFLAYSMDCEPRAATFLFGRAPEGATDVESAENGQVVDAQTIAAPPTVGGSSPIVVIVLDPARAGRIVVNYRGAAPRFKTLVGDLDFTCSAGTSAFGTLDLRGRPKP